MLVWNRIWRSAKITTGTNETGKMISSSENHLDHLIPEQIIPHWPCFYIRRLFPCTIWGPLIRLKVRENIKEIQRCAGLKSIGTIDRVMFQKAITLGTRMGHPDPPPNTCYHGGGSIEYHLPYVMYHCHNLLFDITIRI